MDFDKIKNHWESSFNHKEQLSKQQLAALLRIKESSNTALDKLIRNHRFGLMLTLAMYVVMFAGLVLYVEMPAFWGWLLVITLLMASVFFFSARSYLRLKKVSFTDNQLQPALEKTISEVERNLRFGMGNLYKYVLIPLALIIGICIGIYIGAGDNGFWETVHALEQKSIIKIILVIVIGSAVTVPYSQFVMKRMYKTHVDELKQCLKEFEEEL